MLGAHQIPSLTLNSFEFYLAYNSKDALWSTGVGVEFEVQGDDIRRFIAEVVEAIKELEDELERVVTRSESKNCVEGSHDTSTGREVEKVVVAVLGETTVCRFGELGGKDVGVRIVPLFD